MTIVAIHQPNFFPWLGFFDKIQNADYFVFMDAVDFPRTSKGTWCNRVKLLIAGEPAWFGCPVQRPTGSYPISEVRIAEDQNWRTKLLRTIQMNYKRAPFFSEVNGVLDSLLHYQTDRLAVFNEHAIRTLADALKIEGRFVRQTDLTTSQAGTELLIEITKAVGGNAYLCGGGADGYQIDQMFTSSCIKLIYQNFTPREYPQFNSEKFVGGLSVIDALMNLGFDGTRNLLRIG